MCGKHTIDSRSFICSAKACAPDGNTVKPYEQLRVGDGTAGVPVCIIHQRVVCLMKEKRAGGLQLRIDIKTFPEVQVWTKIPFA